MQVNKYCYNTLCYRLDFYFLKHKLAIEIDEKGQKDRNKFKEIERQKAIRKEVDCKFIGINPDEKDLDKYVEIDKFVKLINLINK